MNRFSTLISVVLVSQVLLSVSCGNESDSGLNGDDSYPLGDPELLEQYPAMDDPYHILRQVDYDEMLDLLDGDSLAVLYFGWSSCPWCAMYVPYINSVAKAQGLEVIWAFDVRETRRAEHDPVTDAWRIVPEFQAIVDRLGAENLITITRPVGCDGDSCTELPWFTVPSVFVVQGGDVLARRIGAVAGHEQVDGVLPPLTDAQRAQLISELEAIFQVARDSLSASGPASHNSGSEPMESGGSC